MKFKQWLLSEELKSANAPNPSLTTKAKSLDAPNLSLATKAKPLDVNSIRYKKNAQNLIDLGNHFKGNDNTEPKPKSPLGKFLRDKRHGFQDFEKIKIDPNHKKTALRKWYKTDKQIGIDAGLPNDWHLFTDKYKPENKKLQDFKKINDENIKKLGKHFKDNNNTEPYWDSDLGIFLSGKRKAFRDYTKIKIDPNHIKTTGNKWYETDEKFGIDAGLPHDWYLFTDKYKPERNDLDIYKQKNNQQLIALGKHFNDTKNNGKEPYRNSDLGIFLYKKRKAYEDYTKKTKKPKYKWYKTDEQVAKDAGLPEGWHLFTDKYKPEKNEYNLFKLKNNKKLKKLGKHFERFGEPKPTSNLGQFLRDKRKAFQDFENKEDPNYKKTTGRKWYKTDLQVAEDAGLPEGWHLPVDKEIQQNNQNIIDLGIHFKDNDNIELDNNSTLGRFLYKKRRAFKDFENKEDPNYTKTTTHKWYDTDEQVAKDAGLPEGWHLPVDKTKTSKGEELVGKILEKLKFNAIHQYRDKGCDIITGRCLRFDYSFEYKDQEYFVEYHGVQHYYPVYFGSTEGMTKKEIAKHALAAFEVVKKSDLQKYNYCKEINNKFPLLVIPYWVSSNKIKYLILSFIKHYDEFNEFFANPDVLDKNEKEHTRMLNMTKCFASGKVNCKELFKKQKTTFEQFLIGKNFTYFNA